MNFPGMSDLKSRKTARKQIKMTAEKAILNFLRKEDVIMNYILIRWIFRLSRFILPIPILWAIGI